ncbi:MAG: cupin [Gammaproteobacteria bacterium]|nr:MAG: cupin [Gammaproteobacteria bacterium]
MTSTRPQAKATLQIENDQVIVTEWSFLPGAETGWHKHGYDYVIVPGTKGKLLLETSEGEKTSDLEVGQSYYRPGGAEHNVVNINDYPFSFVEVELK